MSRSTPEWVAKHDDQVLPGRVKLRIWNREEGRCYLTGRKIGVGEPFDYEHVIALCNGGAHRENNIRLALREAHKAKTAADRDEKSHTERMRMKHLGIWPASKSRLKSRGFEQSRLSSYAGEK